MKNWKTTGAGILAILGVIVAVGNHFINGTPIDWSVTGAAFMAGLGLFAAKDKNVTGGTVQQ